MSFWRSNDQQYSVFSKLVHWITVLAVIGLFALGLWMVSLSYYDPWYRRAPDIHKSIGVLLVILTVVRLVHRLMLPSPRSLSTHSALEKVAGKVMHVVLYLLLFVMFISGYLITTAQGDPLIVLGGVEIPSLISGFANLEDRAGDIHKIVAFILIGMAGLHGLAALKHHFIDKDGTLLRMLTRSK